MTQTETTKDRLRLILGEEGLARLDGACVMVIGLGGVGSNCVEALARGGVGNLVLLDRDVVAPSNVNRQAVAYASTIGRPKADVARAMVLDINPEARVTAVQAFLPKDGIDQTLAPLPPGLRGGRHRHRGPEAAAGGLVPGARLPRDFRHGRR